MIGKNRKKNDVSAQGLSSCKIGGDSLPCCAILESMTDGVFTVDLERRINTFFNRAAEEITGFTFAEAVNQFCFDILRSSTCQTNCPLERTLKTGEPVYNHPAVIISRTGKEIPISVTTALIRNTRGDIIGAVEIFRDLSAMEALRKTIAGGYRLGDMISKNPRMQEIFEILPDIAESDSHLLIQGPSGSGKGLLARAVHDFSPRKDRPFVKVNCGAMPDTLLESELFGYVRGAFTDAKKDKPGRFAAADGGTIFLDEIGDASPALQVKLLRVLEDQTFVPLGGVAPVTVDVRVIAASNKNVPALVQKGDFREDLFYRLNIIKIDLPPLCERREDIPLLVENCLSRFSAHKGKQLSGVSADVLARLMNYPFPGNIRELENILEHAYVLCRGTLIEEKHLPYDFLEKTNRDSGLPAVPDSPLAASERNLIRETLKEQGGNRVNTARQLGVSRTTLWRKIQKHGIHREP
ncbi:MAG: Fis family transcriptional regulator [Syntrophobacterales bacterium CG03_land_8_20_14_0_80_58_14]|nr:MAG: Fis family transcriptional regulator [Syntrophobacterales bacterium CG03_land_8_20_14_0_80_58_14]